MSLAESICMRAALKPVTIPFKLWASWKLVLMTKPQRGPQKSRHTLR